MINRLQLLAVGTRTVNRVIVVTVGIGYGRWSEAAVKQYTGL
jgi:hypothetical protein